jgi:inosine/xanthosine triphosphatase
MTPTVVTVGTNNRLKVSAVKRAFSELFDNVRVCRVNTPTDVPNQPWDDELYLGAKTRAESAMRETKTDYAVGLEAGIVHINDRKMNTACAVIMNQRGNEHIGYSVMFEIPKEILDFGRRDGAKQGRRQIHEQER